MNPTTRRGGSAGFSMRANVEVAWRSGVMTEKHYHLTDKHTHILASLSKDTKQKIIHHHRINGFDEGDLAKFYDLPVEVVWAILNKQ
jgi:hypothetical protein